MELRDMPRKDDRLQLPPIGEYYEDLLSADANINALQLWNASKQPTMRSSCKKENL
jgi:hypothetical protein